MAYPTVFISTRLILWVSVLRPYSPGGTLDALAEIPTRAEALRENPVCIVYGIDYWGL